MAEAGTLYMGLDEDWKCSFEVHPHDSTLGESSREAQSGRRLLGTNGGSLWLWCCLPQPGGAGTLIPSAQRFVWAAKQPLGNAALGALFA